MFAICSSVMETHGFGERWSYWDAIHDVHYGLVARAGARPLSRKRML